MSWQAEIEELALRRRLAFELGGEERIARQHAQGKYTVRERIDRLLDPGSFLEFGGLAGRGTYEHAQLTSFTPSPYVTGTGRVEGRDIVVGGEDFTVRGGASSSMAAGRLKGGVSTVPSFMHELAHAYRLPLVMLVDGSGANVASYKEMGHAYLPSSSDWTRLVDLMAEVPVVGAILGPAAGGPAARALLSHWTCMVRGTSQVFVAGPRVIKRALGEDIALEDLGGAAVHVRQAGTIENAYDTEDELLEAVRRFLSFLPSSVHELPPVRPTTDDPERRDDRLLNAIPRARGRPYNMRRILEAVFDNDCPLFEVQPEYGRCVMTLFGRLNGVPVAIVANDPLQNAGAIDAAGAEKLAHFIELADQFHLPVVHFVDVPGFMIGGRAEQAGTIRKGVRAFYSAYQATVPQVQIIVRRCYGLAGCIRGGALNLRLAWPSAESGSIPIEGGVEVAFKRELDAAPDRAQRLKEIEDDLRLFRSPFLTAEHFGVEDLIDPRDTRPLLCRWIALATRGLAPQLGPRLRAGVRP